MVMAHAGAHQLQAGEVADDEVADDNVLLDDLALGGAQQGRLAQQVSGIPIFPTS
jgi:hypothetical protein